jgi:hypothetical protein
VGCADTVPSTLMRVFKQRGEPSAATNRTSWLGEKRTGDSVRSDRPLRYCVCLAVAWELHACSLLKVGEPHAQVRSRRRGHLYCLCWPRLLLSSHHVRVCEHRRTDKQRALPDGKESRGLQAAPSTRGGLTPYPRLTSGCSHMEPGATRAALAHPALRVPHAPFSSTSVRCETYDQRITLFGLLFAQGACKIWNGW